MFSIVRHKNGWVQNQQGEVLLRDKDANTTLWIPNNYITFNDHNRPIIQPNAIEDSQEASANVLTFEVQPEEELVPEHSYGNYNEEAHSPHNDNEEGLDVTGEETRVIWSHNHTKALITAVEARYEDLFHVHKKKTFWETISQELISQGVEYSATACKRKWANLIRTYKSVKDNKKKTGRGPTRFLFFDQLDALLGDTPTNASPHSIDVQQITLAESPERVESESEGNGNTDSSAPTRKRRNPTAEYVKFKKQYYQQKEQRSDRRHESQATFQAEQLRLMQERNDAIKEKNEIERRKVDALERLIDKLQ